MGEHEGGYQATLTIPERGIAFVGELQPTKKLAEASAAQQALDAMATEIAAAEESHQAAKKAKNQASLAALKERDIAKKAGVPTAGVQLGGAMGGVQPLR